MSRIRICQLVTELGVGGAERCVYEWSRRLDKDRFEVQVAALQGGPVAAWLRDAGIGVTVLGLRGKWDLLKLGALKGLLRREGIDILHTHLFHADVAGKIAAHRAATPHLIHTVHVAEGRFRPWQFLFARATSAMCDRIVCVSRAVMDFHRSRSGLPAGKYQVIYNGVEVDAFARDGAARASLREDLGLSDDQVLLAFVGRLNYQKGIDVMLSAMSHLGARGKPAHLVIAGDGDQRSVVENFIRHGEGGSHARWLGVVTDVRALFSAADVLVMPSRWEGLPLAAAEAMAAGLPVVATRVAGLSELVVDAQTGLLVESQEAMQLAEAIERISADAELRRRLGRAGRQRVIEKFSIQDNVAAYERLYEEIMAT